MVGSKEWGSVPHISDIKGVKKNWGWFLTLGILLCLIGVLVIHFALFATLFTLIFLGIFLVGAGIVQSVQAFMAHKWKGLFPSLLLGLLYLVIGIIFLVKPLASAASLTLLMAAFFFVAGLFRMVTALFMRFGHWGWLFFNGLISFILGILIFSEWPYSGLWLIGLFIGIDLILMGLSWIAVCVAAKKALK